MCDKLYLIPLDRQRQYSLGLNFVEKISSPELPEAVCKWGLQQTAADYLSC